MVEGIKAKLWEVLKEKEVSLAMIFDQEGEILWHRGRKVEGKTVHEGRGFSKTHILKTIRQPVLLEKEDVLIFSDQEFMPESARNLNIKSMIILPVSDRYFLYLDSGVKKSFNAADRELFKVMGEVLGKTIEQIRRDEGDIGSVSGITTSVHQIREKVVKYSIEEEPILLLGETGAGKNYIAGLIHQYSGRKGNFVTLCTPSIAGNLFESAIFGHRKGAFTDAREDKKGFVDEARGGTLFFDEISEVPLAFQAKLLRFIETKKYVVLGESSEREADVRIIAATNRGLSEAIKNKEFREDLYYRLQVLEIRIPPLRERKEDIGAIVHANVKHLKGKKIGKGFWEALQDHDWPGNVRELLTVMIRAGIHGADPITGADIANIIQESPACRDTDAKNNQVDQLWAKIQSGMSFWDVIKKPFLDREINRQQAREIVLRGLKEANGKYNQLITLFHVDQADYFKFMSFLRDNQLQ